MADSYFKFNDLLAKVRKEDLSRAGRFEIEINGPPGLGYDRHVSILCEEAAVPGILIPAAPVKIGNWTEFRAQGLEYLGESASFTFYCDTNWDVRAYFEDWIGSAAIDPLSKEVGFYNNYVGRITIYTLDRGDRRTGAWTLVDAFPRTIALTPLSASNEGINRVNVIMQYKYWKSDALAVDSRYRGLKRFLNFKDLDLKEILRRSL